MEALEVFVNAETTIRLDLTRGKPFILPPDNKLELYMSQVMIKNIGSSGQYDVSITVECRKWTGRRAKVEPKAPPEWNSEVQEKGYNESHAQWRKALARSKLESMGKNRDATKTRPTPYQYQPGDPEALKNYQNALLLIERPAKPPPLTEGVDPKELSEGPHSAGADEGIRHFVKFVDQRGNRWTIGFGAGAKLKFWNKKIDKIESDIGNMVEEDEHVVQARVMAKEVDDAVTSAFVDHGNRATVSLKNTIETLFRNEQPTVPESLPQQVALARRLAATRLQKALALAHKDTKVLEERENQAKVRAEISKYVNGLHTVYAKVSTAFALFVAPTLDATTMSCTY